MYIMADCMEVTQDISTGLELTMGDIMDTLDYHIQVLATLGQATVDQATVGQVTVDQATVGQVMVDQATVGQVTVDQATADTEIPERILVTTPTEIQRTMVDTTAVLANTVKTIIVAEFQQEGAWAMESHAAIYSSRT